MEKFATVDIYVKNYVKTYLEAKYGKTIFLNEKLKDKFIEYLKDKNTFRDAIYTDRFPYEQKITVAISEYEFYHFGFEFTKTNMVKFSKFVEYEIKQISRIYGALFKSFGMTYAKGIKVFQKTYRLSEEDFNFECVRKDIQRNGVTIDAVFEDKIVEILATISKKNIVQFVP
ncbi:MAG: hypothetical protein ACOYOV_06340 [Bacteroidales bacterium]